MLPKTIFPFWTVILVTCKTLLKWQSLFWKCSIVLLRYMYIHVRILHQSYSTLTGHDKSPSHSDKDNNDRTALLTWQTQGERDEMQEKHNFQVCSTSLLRSCQDVTASNTFKLRFVARLITHSPRPLRFNAFFLRPFRSQFALIARLLPPHLALRDLMNSSPRCPRFHSSCKFSWVNYASKRSLDKT